MPIRPEPPAEPSAEHTAWPAPPPRDEAHRTSPSQTLLPDEQPLAGPGEEPGTQATAAHPPSPSAGALLSSLALALLGFVVSATLIHLGLRHLLYLRADYRSGKLQLASAYQGRAFSAAFGSSHVHNGFDPRVFDRVLAGTPLATQSLNLAVIGGSQTEQRVMALDFLHHLQTAPNDAPSACFVLLELNAGANFTTDHLVHPRAINIYDAATDRFALSLTSPQMPRKQRIGRLGFAAAASVLHYLNLGMLSNRLFPPATPDPGYAEETAGDRRGVLTMDATPAVRQTLTGILARAPRRPVVSSARLLPGNTGLIQELAAAVPAFHVHFAYVVEPKLGDLTDEKLYPPAVRVGGDWVPIVNLAQPDRYPQLYQLENWLDDAHLDTQGAALATTLLAQQLQAFYATHPAPMRCGA